LDFEVPGELGEKPAQVGAVLPGQAVEQGGFGGEQVRVGLVEDGAASWGSKQSHEDASRGR
jgi:hypothetical protein